MHVQTVHKNLKWSNYTETWNDGQKAWSDLKGRPHYLTQCVGWSQCDGGQISQI